MTVQEKWRPVRDYENSYVVSNRFRVRSLDRVVIAKNGHARKMKGKILKPLFTGEASEPYVNLQKDAVSNFKTVLRMQIEAGFELSDLDFSVTQQQLVAGWPDTY